MAKGARRGVVGGSVVALAFLVTWLVRRKPKG